MRHVSVVLWTVNSLTAALSSIHCFTVYMSTCLCVLAPLPGHKGPVTSLIAVGVHIWSASIDGTIRIWTIRKKVFPRARKLQSRNTVAQHAATDIPSSQNDHDSAHQHHAKARRFRVCVHVVHVTPCAPVMQLLLVGKDAVACVCVRGCVQRKNVISHMTTGTFLSHFRREASVRVRLRHAPDTTTIQED